MAPSPIDDLELFASCGRTEQELVARLSTVTEVDAGTVLCAEGETGQNFYVLLRGRAHVTVDGVRVAELGPGCGFGEIALLPRGGRRVASVQAATPSRLLVLTRAEFATLMTELPGFARQVLAESRRRVEADTHPEGPWVTS